MENNSTIFQTVNFKRSTLKLSDFQIITSKLRFSSWRLVSLMVFTLLFTPLLLEAEPDRESNAVLVERLSNLQKQSDELKAEIIKLNSQNNELRNELKDINEDLEDFKPFSNWAKILGGLIGGSFLLWAVTNFKTIPKTVDQKVTEKIEEQVKRQITENSDVFLDVLDKHNDELKVKKNNKIVLISHQSYRDTYHKKMLSDNGFNAYLINGIDRLDEAIQHISGTDVLVINNESGNWRPSEIEQFISSVPNFCLFIGTDRITTNGDQKNRFAAVNIRPQFVGNLMSALKYSTNLNQ